MKKSDKAVIPTSDTIPGPGTQEIKIIHDTNGKKLIPSKEMDNETDYIGHGTAQDVPSTSTVPKPYPND